ncbi:MAG: DUF192 domain-containing protein [Candidatus Riflebacteria bacterium]|nr:DUF192 domain-containing protein [Candidatus Riflebacteria bacterium]
MSDKLYKLSRKADNLVLATRLKLRDDFFGRFMGLMFVKELSDGEGLILEPTNSIHMFFMRFAIDALFLDAKNTVVACYDSLRPWIGFSSWHRSAVRVVELKAGILAKNSVKIGDEFDLTENK